MAKWQQTKGYIIQMNTGKLCCWFFVAGEAFRICGTMAAWPTGCALPIPLEGVIGIKLFREEKCSVDTWCALA